MILVVKSCKTCPFCQVKDDNYYCKASIIELRPIGVEPDDRPSWCPLRREQFIVREAPAK
jgi:hypothetical protein